ncbi:MAG: 50S ribosomal protein L6, partial [Bacteroidota bacterium]|nr:50S ribosomal protein L6 [Bacteroidota bacterium]
MSRIGKLPIEIPAGVKFSVSDSNLVTVKGPLGELTQQVDPDISFELEGNTLTVNRPSDEKKHRAIHGLYRSLVNNMVEGVSKGFEIKLELVGVGYRAENDGQVLDLV